MNMCSTCAEDLPTYAGSRACCLNRVDMWSASSLAPAMSPAAQRPLIMQTPAGRQVHLRETMRCTEGPKQKSGRCRGRTGKCSVRQCQSTMSPSNQLPWLIKHDARVPCTDDTPVSAFSMSFICLAYLWYSVYSKCTCMCQSAFHCRHSRRALCS